jgi:hypothetical protein
MVAMAEEAVVMTATAAAARHFFTTATATAVTGHGLVVLTAHESDADDREENRDAQYQCTIHQKTSTKQYRTVSS